MADAAVPHVSCIGCHLIFHAAELDHGRCPGCVEKGVKAAAPARKR